MTEQTPDKATTETVSQDLPMLPPFYLHFRVQTERYDGIRKGPIIKTLAKGGVTAHYTYVHRLTGQPVTEQTPREHIVARVGLAICHPLDAYNRRTGRERAKRRSSEGPKLYRRQITFMCPFFKGQFQATAITIHALAEHELARLVKRELKKVGMHEIAMPSFKLVGPSIRRSA